MPIAAGTTSVNPRTGSQWVLLAGASETGGRGFTVEVSCRPGMPPDVLEHFHAHWTETFTIVQGACRYRLDRQEKSAEAGETFILPANRPHVHPWNAGTGPMVYRQATEFGRPDPGAVDELLGVFFTLFALAGEGKLDARGMPKNPLQLAATLKTLVRLEGYDASVPPYLQKLTAATLGSLAQVLGYRAVRPGLGAARGPA